jgi:type II secretory pathway pseudopilin PulG
MFLARHLKMLLLLLLLLLLSRWLPAAVLARQQQALMAQLQACIEQPRHAALQLMRQQVGKVLRVNCDASHWALFLCRSVWFDKQLRQPLRMQTTCVLPRSAGRIA